MGLGTILRFVGYIVEVACLFGLFQARARAETPPGPTVERLLYLGILAGVGLIVVGNVVNLRARARDDRRDASNDSP